MQKNHYELDYNMTADGVSLGYNYSSRNVTVVGGVLNNITMVIEENLLNVTILSDYDNLPLDGVNITINTTPQTSIVTDADGISLFRNLDVDTYNITVNEGELYGLNYSDFTVQVSGGVTVEKKLLENILNISVRSDALENVIDGVNVTVYSNDTPAEILLDGRGSLLSNLTETVLFGDGNVMYRRVLLEYTSSADSVNTVGISVNGSSVGYGSNMSYMVNVTRGYNEKLMVINRTRLLVNVTDLSWVPFDSTVNVYNLSDLDNPEINSSGDIMSCETGADGLCTFTGLLPKQYNVTAINSKTIDNIDDYDVINITAGALNYLWLDPVMETPFFGSTYYQGFIGQNETFTINVSHQGSAVQDAVVSLYMPDNEYSNTYLHQSGTTNGLGIVSFVVIPGVYDVKIDGSAQGCGIQRIGYFKIGKLLVSSGYTDELGYISLPIDGRSIEGSSSGGYNIYVDSPGYEVFDTYGNIAQDLVGSYYSHGLYDTSLYGSTPNANNDIYNISLTGNFSLSGRISDMYAIEAQAYAKYLATDITLYAVDDEARYEFSSGSDGYYGITLSDYSWGSKSGAGTKINYNISVVKDGYVPGSGYIGILSYDNPVKNIEIYGNSTITGYLYGYNSEEPVNAINAGFKDNLGNKVYSAVTDGEGFFSLIVNPNYAPYTLHFLDPDLNIIAHETSVFSSYNQSNNDEIYYLLLSDQGVVIFNITNETGQSLQSVRINMSMNGSVIELLSSDDGLAQVLIGEDQFSIGRYNITIDGSDIGYGLLSFDSYLDSDYSTLARSLPATRFNLSLNSSTGDIVGSAGDVLVSVSRIGSGFSESRVVDSDGYVLFSRIPIGNYTVSVSNGYYWLDDFVYEVTVDMVGVVNNLSKVLDEPRINFTMIDSDSGNPIENLTITVYYYYPNGSIAVDKRGNALSYLSSAVGEIVFYDMIPGVYLYEIDGSDIGYGVYSNVSISVSALEQKAVALSISLLEVVVDNVTYLGGNMSYPFNISIRDDSGSVVRNVSGEYMNSSLDNSTEVVFRGVEFGGYSIWVYADGMFTRHYDFDMGYAVYPEAPEYHYNIGLYNRTVMLNLYDMHNLYDTVKYVLNTSSFTVSLINGGGVTMNLSGIPNIDTTVDGYAYLYGVADGSYYVSVNSGSNYYTDNSTSFSTYDYDGFVEVYLRQDSHGYINVSTEPYADVYIYYTLDDYVLLDNAQADSNGMVMLKVNTDLYNSSFLVKATKSHYYDEMTEDLNVAGGEIIDILIPLTFDYRGSGTSSSPQPFSRTYSSGSMVVDEVVEDIPDDDFVEGIVFCYSSDDIRDSIEDILASGIDDDVVQYLNNNGYDFDMSMFSVNQVTENISVERKVVNDFLSVLTIDVSQYVYELGWKDIGKIMVVDTLPDGISFADLKFNYDSSRVNQVFGIGGDSIGYIVNAVGGGEVSVEYMIRDDYYGSGFMSVSKSPAVFTLALDTVPDDFVHVVSQDDDYDELDYSSLILPIVVIIALCMALVMYYHMMKKGNKSGKSALSKKVSPVGSSYKGFKPKVDSNILNIQEAISNAVSGSAGYLKNKGINLSGGIGEKRIHKYNKIVSDDGFSPVVVRILDKERFISD